MNDRGMIKWAPFSSVINGELVLREIQEEKSRIIKPTLSEEQIEALEEAIFEKYYSKCPTEVYYYQSEHIYKTKGIITKISSSTKQITINKEKTIFFSNIIKII